MKNHVSKIRVRYGETDQMGVVHHGNYAVYLELARIEWMEQFGISYKKMEEEGLMLPVYEMHFKFKRPATFDEVLQVKTILKKRPDVKIEFDYEIFNEKGNLLTTATTILVFMDANTKRPQRCPKSVLKAIGFSDEEQ